MVLNYSLVFIAVMLVGKTLSKPVSDEIMVLSSAKKPPSLSDDSKETNQPKSKEPNIKWGCFKICRLQRRLRKLILKNIKAVERSEAKQGGTKHKH